MPQRKRKRVAQILLAGLLTLGISVGNVFAQVEAKPAHRFEFQEVLSIGDDESASRKYLFSNPEHIRTDADGRIYVAEGRGVGQSSPTQVRVFGPGGEFLGALGHRGGGPGEFKYITAIAIDSEGRLVVYDNRTDRFTRFPSFETIDSFPRPDPDRIETFPNPEEYRLSLGFMYGLQDGHFVLLYLPPRGQRSPHQPRLHVYDENFDKIGAFATPNQWNLSDDTFSQHLAQTPLFFGGSHVGSDTSSLILAPRLYRGVLYRYTSTGNGSWTLQRLEGRNPSHPTHEVVTSPNEPFSFFTSAGVGARYRSASHGAGRLNDGRVVHLSTSEDQNGVRQLQLEVFRPDGTLQKVGRIKGFMHDKTGFEAVNQAVAVSLLWVDRKNRLYLEDRRGGFPVIRVMKLKE